MPWQGTTYVQDGADVRELDTRCFKGRADRFKMRRVLRSRPRLKIFDHSARLVRCLRQLTRRHVDESPGCSALRGGHFGRVSLSLVLLLACSSVPGSDKADKRPLTRRGGAFRMQ